MTKALRELTVPGDGVRLHVAVTGEGVPVVLLHGFPEGPLSWRHQVEPLARAGFSVWVPAQRGYGASARPRDVAAYRMRHLVADAAAVVRATGAPRAHVLGHDWGGVVAWGLAGTQPSLVDRLVVLNAPHPRLFARRVRSPAQLLRSWYAVFFQLPRLPELILSARGHAVIRRVLRDAPALPAFTPGEIDECVAMLARPGALTAALNYYRASFRTGTGGTRRSNRVEAETLVIWGERDRALGRSLLRGLDEFVTSLRVHRIASAGHWVHREATGEVNRQIVDFLSEPARQR
jgi:epoxide hydrolase 4